MLLTFAVLLPWIVAGFGVWLGYQLLRQNGRILLHLDTLQERLEQIRSLPQAAPAPSQAQEPQIPAGLPVGTPAPEFDLRDLAGGRRALAHFRGQRLLLVFFNPQCGYCSRMGSDLAALPTDGENGQPIPVVLTSGDAAANRKFFQEQGIHCPVLLLEQSDLASQYQANGTPMGYLVDEQGRIASPIAAGADALLALVGASSGRQAPQAAPSYQGLTPGTPAPEFTLPRLAGGSASLADYRGRRVLAIFFNPQCGFCAQMGPDLAGFPADGSDGRPIPLVVTTGDAAANRKFFEEQGIRCPVLLQEQMEVAARYQAGGTPMGYLIDEEGRIASEIAAGAQALLALANAPAPPAPNAAGHDHKEHKGNRSIEDSRIQRGGLEAGTPAPSFTLPRLDSGELSLEAYRGRKVLLVFSDPKCGPCNALAPRLEESYRRNGDVQVILVSRGDRVENREKVEEYGLTFPVVLQRQWEVSRDYAMFSTPVAYLIDENGTIAADVAMGADQILTLLEDASTRTPAPAPQRRCPCGKVAGECGCGNGKKNGRALAGKQIGR